MICPNCGRNQSGKKCAECGFDLYLYQRFQNISVRLYNEGLNKAKRGDLTGAIKSLSHSLEFDKLNIPSRNLLGLCRLGIGEPQGAISAWRKSLRFQENDNPAAQLLKSLEAERSLLDKMANAIKLYNQSLNYVQSNSEDMAIIRLKKAIEQSPNFVEAMNLLALCHLKEKDSARALTYLERVLSIDSANPTALHLLNEIKRPRPDLKRPKVDRAPVSRHISPVPEKRLVKSLHIAEIICFIIGALISLGLVYYLIVPDVISQKDAELDGLRSQMSQQATEYQAQITKKDLEITSLTKDIENAETENKTLKADIELRDRIQSVYNGQNLFTQGLHEEAVAVMSAVATDNLPIDVVETRNTVLIKAQLAAETKFHNTGLTEYNARRYDTAKAAFLTCVVYENPESTFADDAYYFLGRIAEVEGDKTGAKEYYDLIEERYPNSNQIWNVRARVRNLK